MAFINVIFALGTYPYFLSSTQQSDTRNYTFSGRVTTAETSEVENILQWRDEMLWERVSDMNND